MTPAAKPFIADNRRPLTSRVTKTEPAPSAVTPHVNKVASRALNTGW